MSVIASSYFIRQSPGGERYEGVTIRLSPSPYQTGKIEIKLTAYRSGKLIDKQPLFLDECAKEAINLFAQNNSIDLSQWNITVSDFAYHPVDTKLKGIQYAIYNTLITAYAQYFCLTVNLPPKKAK